MKNQNPTKHVNLDLNDVDHVSSNVRPSRFGAVLYVFDDNEALMEMEMDSHGGLEVTIRQTESKKKKNYPTTS